MTNAKTFAWAFGLCLFGSGALAIAQTKPAPAMCDHCPMKAASELSDIKVELTKTGAIIRLTSKRPEDLSKVQESAQEIASALSSADCMMHGKGGMHHHEHDHAHMAPPAAK